MKRETKYLIRFDKRRELHIYPFTKIERRTYSSAVDLGDGHLLYVNRFPLVLDRGKIWVESKKGIPEALNIMKKYQEDVINKSRIQIECAEIYISKIDDTLETINVL